MAQQLLTQKEFIERYEKGERNFSNTLMQFFDISNMKFGNVVFKDCKLLFCTFRNCEFENVAFEDCEIYCGSFYTGSVSNTSFNKCRIELTLFDSIQFDRTKMDKCNIRLCCIFNSNPASVDFSTSTQSRLLTDVSQITRADIEGSINEAMAIIERLDVSTRMKLKELLRQDMERYGLAMPEEKKGGGYGSREADKATIAYGEVRHLLELTFGAYSQENKYAMKSPYEKQDEDMNRRKRTGPPF